MTWARAEHERKSEFMVPLDKEEVPPVWILGSIFVEGRSSTEFNSVD